MQHTRARFVGILGGLALLLAACAAEPGPEPDAAAGAEASETTEAPAASDAAEGDDGRAFDSTDDAVITAIEAALSGSGAKAHWEGDRLIVDMEGSAEDPTAWLGCTAVLTVVADDERATLVYPDGELPCEERPGQ